jgi:hypothetical protein
VQAVVAGIRRSSAAEKTAGLVHSLSRTSPPPGSPGATPRASRPELAFSDETWATPQDGLTAPCVFDGAINGDRLQAKPGFLTKGWCIGL